MSGSDLLSDLNDPQRAAVLHGDGPLLVVAGAGSGKTRVITRRIASLIDRGIDAHRILALTFTNKAAGEMRQRVDALAPGSRVWVSTFHSACARILRREAPHLGLDRAFSIYDADDTEAVLKQVVADLGLDIRQWPVPRLRARISNLKNDLRTPDEAEDGSFDGRALSEAWRAYQERLRAQQALDFDDLLVRAVEIVRDHPETAPRYAERFDHVLIDEYQDTNAAQYAIVRALADRARNVCATGDPDQAIYGWRGADIRNILEFERDFPDAVVIRLEQNYRSTRPILRAADALIRNNADRVERSLWCDREAGVPVRVITLEDDRAEADEIVRRIRALQRGPGAPRKLPDVAVFYRTNAQSRAVELACIENGVPYQIVGGVAFYQRREIKDLVAYLRLRVNPADNVALQRIVNVPRRGIGAATLQMLAAFAGRRGTGILAALPAALDPQSGARLPGRGRTALARFAELMRGLADLPTSPVAPVVRAVIERTAYEDSLDPKEDADRLGNVRELINAAANFDLLNPDGDLATFLEEAALATDLDRYAPDEDRITLMTLHMAKGLEFPVVFIAGLEEKLLPHARAVNADNPHLIEEERRLAYVGMTRAMDELFLLHARHRMIAGRRLPAARSRFLDEVPDDVTEREDFSVHASYSEWGSGPASVGDRFTHRTPSHGTSVEVEYDDDAAAAEALHYQDTDWDAMEATASFAAGDRVRHRMFGEGRVERVEGSGARAKLTVLFQRHGRKKLSLEHAPIVKIG